MLGALPEIHLLVLALGVGLLGGIIKGVVGFALPVVIVSGLSAFLAPELALAGLVVPALVTNVWQALRQGPEAAVQSFAKIRFFLIIGGLAMFSFAQLVPRMSVSLLYLSLGVPIALFAVSQLAGWRPVISPTNRPAQATAGFISGAFGGLAGVFGPPLVIYLTAVNTPKTEQMRIQGVVFALGSLLFATAHMISGVVRFETLVFSAFIAAPAMIGTAIGFAIQDRVDQATFRKLTLLVLLLAGLNLIRRGLIG